MLRPAHTGHFLSLHAKGQMHSKLSDPPQLKPSFTHAFLGTKGKPLPTLPIPMELPFLPQSLLQKLPTGFFAFLIVDRSLLPKAVPHFQGGGLSPYTFQDRDCSLTHLTPKCCRLSSGFLVFCFSIFFMDVLR